MAKQMSPELIDELTRITNKFDQYVNDKVGELEREVEEIENEIQIFKSKDKRGLLEITSIAIDRRQGEIRGLYRAINLLNDAIIGYED